MLTTQSSTLRIYAHRGSSQLAPENTQVAFDIALHYGSDVLETDVRISADGQVIVTHDATVDRTTDGYGKIRHLTLQQLKKLDAGYRSTGINGENFRGKGVRLMTLDELFQCYPNTAINIDIKDNDRNAAQLVAEAITQAHRTHDVVVGSFHAQVVLYFRLLAPQIRTAAVLHEVAQLYLQHLPLTVIKPTMNYSAVQIPTSWKLIPLSTRRFIQHVKNNGKEICYWTINDAVRMRKLLALGANGIITDRPDIAQQVLNEQHGRR